MKKSILNGLFILNEIREETRYVDLFRKLKNLLLKHDINLALAYSSTYLTSVREYDYPKTDFVIMYDTDANLALHFESNGVRVFNSPLAIRNASDQAASYLLLERIKEVNLIPSVISPFTNTRALKINSRFVSRMIELITFPLIIKDTYSIDGLSLMLIKSEKEFKKVMKKMLFSQLIVEQHINTKDDYRAYVVNNQVIAIIKRSQTDEKEFRSNVGAFITERLELAKHQEIVKQAVLVSKVLQLDFGALDFLLGEDGEFYFCDANVNPMCFDCESGYVEALSEYIKGQVYAKTK